MDWINSLEPHWFWLALGLVLAIGEITIPGVFLIWLAAAALVTGGQFALSALEVHVPGVHRIGAGHHVDTAADNFGRQFLGRPFRPQVAVEPCPRLLDEFGADLALLTQMRRIPSRSPRHHFRGSAALERLAKCLHCALAVCVAVSLRVGFPERRERLRFLLDGARVGAERTGIGAVMPGVFRQGRGWGRIIITLRIYINIIL